MFDGIRVQGSRLLKDVNINKYYRKLRGMIHAACSRMHFSFFDEAELMGS